MNTLFSQWQPGKCATIAAVVAMWGFCGSAIHAKPLGNATVTQVNNDVRFKPTTGNERPAKAKDIVKGSDTLRTGQKSQAEIEFEDRTITRLGSNSTFTFDPDKREFQLKRGLLLFDMPKGAGGGKIITPAGTAAIEGTAGIVSYRSAPKIICLAGVINVLNPNGQLMAKVMPGQLFIMGVTKHPVDFMLNGVKTGKLMSGGLPNNTEEFNNSNNEQLQQVQTGQLQATPFVMLGEKTDVFVATATTTHEQYTQGTEVIDHSHDLPPEPEPTTFAINSDTTINAGTGVITGTDSLQGTVQNGKATFDFGTKNVTISGNPTGVPAANGTFNADFNTQGTVLFDNMPQDTSPGGPIDQKNNNLKFSASSINFVNSFFDTGDFEVGGNVAGPSSLSFYTDGNLMVDPSVLRVRSGPDDGGPYTAGLIHLESARGLVTFVGSGYDPDNDPTDLLRSHARATINTGGGIYDGGTVELISKGTRVLLVDGYLYPYDGVFVHDATIDVAPKNYDGYLTSGNGGNVRLSGKMQVLIEDTVDIDATGTIPGTVTIQSAGINTMAGLITLSVPNSTGHIRMEAQTTFAAINGGEINLNGFYDGGYSINLMASGPAGGGRINVTAFGGYYAPNSWMTTYYGLAGINIFGARLDASAPSDTDPATTLPAGRIVLKAPEITLDTAHLSAGDFFATYYSGGPVGRIEVSGVNPNGTHLGTAVNIANSTLTVGGTGSDGGIFISGDQVTIDTASMNDFYTDPAKVHIQSRQNTGDWSTNPANPIYWTPLYFIMDDTTTIDVSGATPTIVGSGGSLDGTFSGSGAAVFDFGTQNVLLWPNNPHSTPNGSGIFKAEFYTSGSFEALGATPGTGGSGSSAETSLVSIHASGIQIVNSIFNMGANNALNGPSEFQLFSSTDTILVSPYDPENSMAPTSVFTPSTGIVGEQVVGGKLHLESAGVTAFGGGERTVDGREVRITQALVGATDVGGIVEIKSTGNGTGPGGQADGVHIRNAFIDVSHPITTDYPYNSSPTPALDGGLEADVLTAIREQLAPTPALVGGTVTLDGKMQVSIHDTTDIYADGSTAAGSIQVKSSGDSLEAGRVRFYVEDRADLGHIFLSAQEVSSSSALDPGNIAFFGSTLGDGTKTVNITASGDAGGGVISVEAPGTIYVANAALDASALADSTESGGTIRLHAGASPNTPTDGSVALQTFSAELRARGFDGGEVTTIPSGTGSFYLPASLEMHGTLIDVSSYGGTSPGNTPQGGNVSLNGTLSAMIFGDQYGSTDITADGPTVANGAVAGSSAGSINISSPGTDSTPGNVTILDVESNKTHYVRLSARDSAVVFDALNNGGNIEIHGADARASGNETVQIVASGPAGGGNITISAIQNLSIINAQLNANGAGSLPGGTITLNGVNVYVLNSLLTASSALGQAGRIALNGSSSVSALNSILQTLGMTAAGNSGIYISAPTVNLAGTTLIPGPTGAAQIYANTFTPPASGAGTYVQHPFGP
ncbi:MAG: FecR family protein [Verrucomicrobia bacterium]|nr:FecR family protein [Verrucomicrobiota bacterium]